MYIVGFWEVARKNKKIWEFLQATPDNYSQFDGQSWLVRWEQGKGFLHASPTAYPSKGLKAVGSNGIAVHRMGNCFLIYIAKNVSTRTWPQLFRKKGCFKSYLGLL
jgi:hypothetical protein